jgi:hypothetical protein
LVFARITTLCLAGMLAACGGGGGGGGGSGSAGGSGGDTPLTYMGKTTAAVIATTNAAFLTANIVGGADTSNAFTSAAAGTGGDGVTELEKRLTRAVRAKVSPSGTSSRGLRADPIAPETDPCDGGNGTVQISGDISPSGPGTLNFVWSNCLTGDSTLNGSASVRVDAFDPTFGILDGTFNFVRVSVISPAASGTVSGALRLQVNPAGNSETTTSSLVSLDAGGRMTKADSLVVVDVFSNISDPNSSSVETITGRLFDSVEGFVDIATTTPLAFATQAQLFASSGQIVLTGNNNGHVRAVAVSSNLVELDLDLDGDNTFESTAFLKWTELTAPAGADLADSDGDHMHDSWERVNGLNPNDPSDALLDPDGDGFNNLAEYRAGTDPRDPTSHP